MFKFTCIKIITKEEKTVIKYRHCLFCRKEQGMGPVVRLFTWTTVWFEYLSSLCL